MILNQVGGGRQIQLRNTQLPGLTAIQQDATEADFRHRQRLMEYRRNAHMPVLILALSADGNIATGQCQRLAGGLQLQRGQLDFAIEAAEVTVFNGSPALQTGAELGEAKRIVAASRNPAPPFLSIHFNVELTILFVPRPELALQRAFHRNVGQLFQSPGNLTFNGTAVAAVTP